MSFLVLYISLGVVQTGVNVIKSGIEIFQSLGLLGCEYRVAR
jgi:hypothetical protein